MASELKQAYSGMYPLRVDMHDHHRAIHTQARIVEGHGGALYNQHERHKALDARTGALEVDARTIRQELTEIKTTLKVGFGAVTLAITIAGIAIGVLVRRDPGPALLPPVHHAPREVMQQQFRPPPVPKPQPWADGGT